MAIPVEFEHGGRKFSGRFENVSGGGAGVYHLYDDKNYYLGRLREARGQWVFDSTPKSDLSGLAGFFGDHVSKFLYQ